MTLEQVNAAAKKYLVRDQRAVVITLPAAADRVRGSAPGAMTAALRIATTKFGTHEGER